MSLQEELERRGNWLFKHRGTLPIIILLFGLIVNIYQKKPERTTIQYDDSLIFELICLGICLFGLLIRIYTVGYTPVGTSGRNTDKQIADSLNTTGIYSIVRNPLYLGNYFLWLGIAMLTFNFWFVLSFSLIYFIYYLHIIFSEEQFLKNKFGNIYTEWAKKTPLIIPKLKLLKKTNLTFSWKKVLKKEKNAFAAIFLIFCLFDITEKIAYNKTNFNTIWIYMAVFSSIIYLILRTIKRKTKLLDEPNR